AEERKRSQDAFSNDEVDIIVATIAFGMGIDKSNVRYVLHTAMPKSVEHYQQETGRAGRDGLSADCCLLYSYQDFRVWEGILNKSEDDEARAIAQQKLRDMLNYCQRTVCRHKALSEYFGQPYTRKNCGACDMCRTPTEIMEDSGSIAGHILAAVRHLGDIAGPSYTTLILTGSKEERILMRRHNKCAGYGTLKSYDKQVVRDWIEQIVHQGYLEKQGEYNILVITEKGRAALAGDDAPQLSQPAPKPKRAPKKIAATKAAAVYAWVDPDLFESLKKVRLDKARELGVPPFVVFSDAALRDMARRMPGNRREFLAVEGVGEKKCEAFGDFFIAAIRDYQENHPGAATETMPPPPPPPKPPRKINTSKRQAAALFAQGMSIEKVAETIGRSPSTVAEYCAQYLSEQQKKSPAPWVSQEIMDTVSQAFAELNTERLKPVFERLNGKIPYWKIRLCKACLENSGSYGGQGKST
ncbi:MAG TPA: RecQ family ATP-dependent DNA helicase, partial [Candidatus Hydrogenedentes bacterium]|nr:RecQ family ATP-dependent DNA helicase [Candidatus Hydrogenedentota bacterium]